MTKFTAPLFCYVFQRGRYTNRFKENGYDNTMLISGMTEKELKEIGVNSKLIVQKLQERIQNLPNYEIVAEVPVRCLMVFNSEIPCHRTTGICFHL